MIASLTPARAAKCLTLLKEHVEEMSPALSETFLDLGGVKKVRVEGYHPAAGKASLRQLGFCATGPSVACDATIRFWMVEHIKNFHKSVLGLDFDLEEGDNYLLLARRNEEGKLEIFAEIEYLGGAIKVWDGDEYYFGAERMDQESLLRSGHLFVKCLYRILETPSTAMAHSACIGLDGTGVLICARGGKGKSTLAVSSMLRGFEYVSDDYTMLEKDGDNLLASPIYSIITLSPTIYNLLYDELTPARFVADNAKKDKYVFDISAWKDSVRTRYPVKACLFPEIRPDLDPGVFPCSLIEKGRAITNLVHSTQMQMIDQGNSLNSKKMIGMLQGLDFYRIQLCPDIFKNVETLRDFIKKLNTN